MRDFTQDTPLCWEKSPLFAMDKRNGMAAGQVLIKVAWPRVLTRRPGQFVIYLWAWVGFLR